MEKDFIDKVKETIESGGSVLIPAFAVGRAQKIIDILNEYKINEDFPVYLDGMAQRVSNVYMRYPGYFKNPYELREALSKTIWIRNQKMRKKATKQQSIIVTTAGMLEGGPILFYIKKLYNDPKTNILLTGYQVKDTKGSNLLEKKEIEIEGNVYRPKGEVIIDDFSAHIGRKYLFKTISYWNPKKVICVHGDAEVIDKFSNHIKEELGIDANWT